MANDSRSLVGYVEAQPADGGQPETPADKPARRGGDAPHRLLRAVVLVLGVSLSAALGIVIHNMLERDAVARDEVARQSLAAALKGNLERELDFFTPVKGLFESSDFVTDLEFKRFVELDKTIRSRQSWLKIAWAPRDPSISAKDVFRIAYAEPEGAKAELPVGNLGDSPASQSAMARAAASGDLALTVPEEHVIGGRRFMSMTGFVPIYPGSNRAASNRPVGFIVGVIELDGMVASFLNQNLIYAGFGLRAYDGSQPMFEVGPPAHDAPAIPLLIGDRQWNLQVVSPLQSTASVLWLPSLIFVFGLALTTLLYFYFVRSDTEYARIAIRVRKATLQLETANQELELRSQRLEALAIDLRRTSEEAQLANAAKTMFLANMSHELRTPLNAVIGFSQVISTQMFGAGSPRYADYARDIHSSGEHLLGIIEGLLDMSRIELGMLQLNDKAIRLNALVDDAVRFTNHRARERGIAVRHSGLTALPSITGDARALRQVLINLVTNAIKFSEAGTTIHIAGEMLSDGGVVLHVSDQGCGIKPENLEHIFEPFWQNEAYLSQSKDGVGLGLAITRRLVEAHDGQIDVVSQIGYGTTVSVRLPASRIIREAEAS